MMETEMDDHLGYSKSERSDSNDYRNGYKTKWVNSSYGSMEIEVPQDRKSTFKPQVVKKHQKDISDIDQKIISIYAKSMTTRQISDTLEDIYGLGASEGFISDVTDKIIPRSKIGKIVLFSRFIQRFILMRYTILFVTMVSSENLRPMSFLESIRMDTRRF